VAYEKYSSTDDLDDQANFLKQHIQSLRGHVRSLSSKSYEQIHGFKSPDFVLMFIPVEPAFGLAMQNDPDLYNEAFEKNIIIVSPTTLLATLSTIENVWKQEYQNQNAMEIAKRGGLLYDKFVGFVENLEDVGKRIRQTNESYESAMKQLSTGAGNLVGQAEKLRDLGANASKKLSGELTDRALESGSNSQES
jgi:DNA recombination protein RmuC